MKSPGLELAVTLRAGVSITYRDCQSPRIPKRGARPLQQTTFAVPAPLAAAALELPAWSVVPFALLLLCIAVLPLAAEHWWHQNRNKAIVGALLALPTAAFLAFEQFFAGQPALEALGHEIGKYASFILLLGSLFIVGGGVVLRGDLPPTPWTNAGFLAFGAALANLVGTTGASMLLLRPFLRINRDRRHKAHLPIFFIFLVSNLGGCLTPLGDPPLFMGFLNGVPFHWTLALWPQWLVANTAVLTVFVVWDLLAYRREAPTPSTAPAEPLQIRGVVNLLLLAGIIGGVLLQGLLAETWGQAAEVAGGVVMAAMAGLSLCLTPQQLRRENSFHWGPIVEVAVLFAGIFVTMVPALALLEHRGKDFGLTAPWQYFWLTGVLSAFLDNAPTYLAFGALSVGSGKFEDFSDLAREQPVILQAISCGAVFFGALTYIGNGPNFMVKAMAEEAGYKMPSFFGYLAYSSAILLPVFVVITLLFFPPWR
jgi:Na+/H+ antiporter NhaD/arsenite permease-like protein